MVVYDEISKLKNSTSLRVRGGNRDRKDKRGDAHKIKVIGWRSLINTFQYRMGLTGTPASNGYIDLHGQFLVVDGGKRLTPWITHYREAYFIRNFNGWGYTPSEIGKTAIESKIADITKKMDSADYLDLPKSKTIDVMVNLPKRIKEQYKELEKEMFVELDSKKEIEVFSASSLSNKCLQFANGSPYINRAAFEWEALHAVKLDALEDILEEAAGSPVLCGYSFRSDAERIMKHFKKYRPVNLTKEPAQKTKEIIDKWNRGEIKLLIGHPASMGHGIDGLQESGSIIVWFGLNWNLELYDQLNGRIDGARAKKPVSIIRILCNDTTDLAVRDSLERKDTDQKGLKDSLNRYKKGVLQEKRASFI